MELKMICLKICSLFCFLVIAVGPHKVFAQTWDDVDNIHPDWKVSSLRPANWEVQVVGMDLMADGKLVVLEMHEPITNKTGIPKPNGRLFLVQNPESIDPEKITYTKIADSLKEPVGMLIKDGKIYVAEKNELTEYTLNSAGDHANKTRTVAKIPHDSDGNVNFQENAFGLIYKAGFFYLASGGAVHDGGWSFLGAEKELNESRVGCVLKINETDGSITQLNAGMRAPNGIAWGPEGNIWVTDNQGSYRPSSQLTLAYEGKNFGYPNHKGLFADLPVTPPSLWLPHGEISRSPTFPVLISHGTYAGQFLVGDLSQGGIKRANVEKVGSGWQGAVFSFTGGLEVGVEKIIELADGSLYFGGLGNGDFGNWGWAGKRFGLQKLSPKGTATAFEMLAIRSRKNGMEIEFSKPVGPEGEVVANYSVQSALMKPESGYGAGNWADQKDISIKSIQLSSDRKKVLLVMDLIPGCVLRIKTAGVRSATKDVPRCPAGWYTLNEISTSDAFTVSNTIAKTSESDQVALHFNHESVEIQIKNPGQHKISIATLDGKIFYSIQGSGSQKFSYNMSALPHGLYLMKIEMGKNQINRSFIY